MLDEVFLSLIPLHCGKWMMVKWYYNPSTHHIKLLLEPAAHLPPLTIRFLWIECCLFWKFCMCLANTWQHKHYVGGYDSFIKEAMVYLVPVMLP